MVKDTMKKLRVVVTDLRTIIIIFGIAGMAIVATQNFTKLPGRVDIAEARIEGSEEDIEENKDAISQLALTVEASIKAQDSYHHAQEQREELMTQLIIQGLNR